MDDFPAGNHPLGRVVYLPCGGCLACRRERRQELTLLQCCEASLHNDNWFITLTYEDWPTIQLTGMAPYSLSKVHLSTFCESMRKYARYHGSDFRFFACGEYGERYGRPHYHMSVFGLSPELLGIAENFDASKFRRKGILHDGKFIRSLSRTVKDSKGNEYWQSHVIEVRWPYGVHKIYRANRETMQYVAGYVTKKLTGDGGVDFRSSGKISEFQVQSRPSIGRPWFERYFDSISQVDGEKLVNDVVSVYDIQWKCPRIFDRWLQSRDYFDGPLISEKIKFLRTLGYPLMPDRQALKCKADFDRYSAAHFKDNNRSHKEVK